MTAPIVDHVPRIRQVENAKLNAEHSRIVGKIALETDNSLPPSKHVPGDPTVLRGIPVVGVPGGRGGAIPGTRPTDAISRIRG